MFRFELSRGPAIFVRSSDLFVQQILVAKTPDALKHGDYLMRISETSILNFLNDSAKLFKSEFVRISVNEPFVTLQPFDLPVVKSEELANRSGILPGEYWLQIDVATWSGSSRLAAETEAALGIRQISTDTIRSSPLPLKVGSPVDSVSCGAG